MFEFLVIALLGWVGWSMRRDSRALLGEIMQLQRRLAALEDRAPTLNADASDAISAPPLAPAQPQPPTDNAEPIASPWQTGVAMPAAAAPPASAPVTLADGSLSAPAPPAPRRELESLIGGNWAVWVGALSLALGGIFLVRYSIEHGVFGPAARIGMALALGLTLLAAGEWLRRTGKAPPAREGWPSVPALATAAGAVTLFGALYAAHALYDLIGPSASFALLALVGLGTMALALLHGVWLAALGMIGALASPMLIGAGGANPWVLVAYLGILSAASHLLFLARRWMAVPMLNALGIGLWLVLLMQPADPAMTAFWSHLVVQATLAAVLLGYARLRAPATPDFDGLIHVALTFPLLTALARLLRFGPIAEAPGAYVVFSLLALTGALMPRAAFWLAGAALLGFAFIAGGHALLPDALLRVPAPTLASAPPSVFVVHLVLPAAALMAIIAARLSAGRSLSAGQALAYGLIGCAMPSISLLLGWLSPDNAFSDQHLMAGGLAATLIMAGMALLFMRTRRDSNAALIGAEAFAFGAVLALALALFIGLRPGWIIIGLALTTALAATLSRSSRLISLRYAAGLVALAVLGLSVRNPLVGQGSIGAHPLVNWIIPGYGLPALAFLWGAWRLARTRRDAPQHLLEGLGLLYAALTPVMLLRHALHGDALFDANASHSEIGLHLFLSAAFAAVLIRVDGIGSNRLYRIATALLAVLAVPVAIIGLALLENPLFGRVPVIGNLVFNSLMLGYLLPALGFAALYALARSRRPRWYCRLILALAVGLGLAYAALELRFIIHHRMIAPANHLEFGLDTLAALAFAFFLSWGGRRWGDVTALLAGRIITGLAVGLGLITLWNNPFLVLEEVGGPLLFDTLTLAYLLPMFGFLLLTRHRLLMLWPKGELVAGAMALLMLIAWLTLEVRHAFHGPIMADTGMPMAPAELWSYSALWLAVGVAVLALGIRSGDRMMRLASLVLILLAVCKVFLIDMRDLEGLWRALSFIGLGVVLMGIGLVYQNFVFGRKVMAAPQ